MAIQLVQEGARLYFRGDTYSVRDRLRSAGAHWDAGQKSWWLGTAKREEAEALLAQIAAGGAGEAERLDPNAPLLGRARYKGRTYLIAWEGETKRGRAFRLAFTDGSKVFWASAAEVEVVRRYSPSGRAVTLLSLQEFAARRERERTTGVCECRCHREPNAGQPGSTLYDGCDRCGCEAC